MDAAVSIDAEKLNSILLAYGIAENYIDFSGNTVTIPRENRLRVLSELGIKLPAVGELDSSLEQILASRGNRLLDPVIVCSPGTGRIPVHAGLVEADREIHWSLLPETGSPVEDIIPPGSARGGIGVPPLDAGYYHFTVRSGQIRETALIIVAPDRAHEPQFIHEGRRVWGLSVQLYTLRSAHNWGMGDFSDLRELVDQVTEKGGDFILLNPLHALDIHCPENASPYSPVDRRFLNPLYIDPLDTGESDGDRFQQWLADMTCPEDPRRLREADQVDYKGVSRLKYAAFEQLYQDFREKHLAGNSERARDFRHFLDSKGAGIYRFGEFQALEKIDGVPSSSEPEFHLYLQWLASIQLDRVQQAAIAGGMKIGLIRDLAVGATDNSCEIWEHPHLFCREARIGAPPDHFNPLGQNWGLTPMRPDRLEKTGFSHFIRLLRANMAGCGALRLDHVMSLMRLWWCPAGGANAAGAYVRYDADALFAILRLESERARCMIIGEDLGVVPPEIRAHIHDSGILSNTIFYFERYEGGYFKKPEHYNPRALAIIANHDVPTLKAWWNTNDLALRKKIGLIGDNNGFAEEQEQRFRDKHLLLTMLEEIHLLPLQWQDKDIHKPFDQFLGRAIIRACASSPSSLVSLQLDDLAGMDTPVNIPGTDAEYSNWRRKIPVSVKELFAGEDALQTFAVLHEERP